MQCSYNTSTGTVYTCKGIPVPVPVLSTEYREATTLSTESTGTNTRRVENNGNYAMGDYNGITK